MLTLIVGYAASMLVVGFSLDGSSISAGTAALFLLPSLIFGALIARWWALVLPLFIGAIAKAYYSRAVCRTNCFADLLGDLPLLLAFAIPSACAMLVGVALGKSIRHLHRRRVA
ncbi:MAG: hypothetical protein M3N16_02010 [Actinomycetota bacterium]|nr:hypothetical protein [Actinomycetota bacterium]